MGYNFGWKDAEVNFVKQRWYAQINLKGQLYEVGDIYVRKDRKCVRTDEKTWSCIWGIPPEEQIK